MGRPGFDDDKEDTATIVSSAPTVSAVSSVTAPVQASSSSVTASSDLQLRLNLQTITPTQQPTQTTLPYAAMLEQHSRSSTLPSALPSALPFYNLAGLAAHGAYNSL